MKHFVFAFNRDTTTHKFTKIHPGSHKTIIIITNNNNVDVYMLYVFIKKTMEENHNKCFKNNLKLRENQGIPHTHTHEQQSSTNKKNNNISFLFRRYTDQYFCYRFDQSSGKLMKTTTGM